MSVQERESVFVKRFRAIVKTLNDRELLMIAGLINEERMLRAVRRLD